MNRRTELKRGLSCLLASTIGGKAVSGLIEGSKGKLETVTIINPMRPPHERGALTEEEFNKAVQEVFDKTPKTYIVEYKHQGLGKWIAENKL